MIQSSKRFPIVFGDYSFNHMKSGNLSREYLSWMNDKSHLKWSNQRTLHHTKSSSKKFLKKHDTNENLFLSIRYRNQMIGTVTIYVDNVNKVATAGLLISNRMAGQGFGKVVWSLVVNELSRLLDIRKIKAGVAEGNVAMRNVMEQSGMALEAVLKHDLLFDGSTEDLLVYSKFIN